MFVLAMSMPATATGGAGALAALSLWAAFGLGLVGGFTHCLTMCGPLVAAASMRATGAAPADPTCAADVRGRGVRFQVGYHAGRLLTYAVLGALLGLAGYHGVLSALGRPLGSVQVAVALRVIAGVAIVASGAWLIASALGGRFARLPEPTSWIARLPWFSKAAAALSEGRWGLPFGMLMGLLPCMPLLPIEIGALASASVPGGMALMLAFGLGTLPALVSVGALSSVVGARAQRYALPVAGALVVVLGVVTLAQAAMLARPGG